MKAKVEQIHSNRMKSIQARTRIGTLDKRANFVQLWLSPRTSQFYNISYSYNFLLHLIPGNLNIQTSEANLMAYSLSTVKYRRVMIRFIDFNSCHKFTPQLFHNHKTYFTWLHVLSKSTLNGEKRPEIHFTVVKHITHLFIHGHVLGKKSQTIL